ncbi:Glutathione S-transferase family protein [Klebsormidium nitens]|uniref:glutathione transferase n=1 Tax=Klebsormidium nitens TaxID=105231 RepID=A0A1Y1I467_KLENI|nr:Glutathione S-transferase family protein [Klebsormidium nitens]|eukprot:GAQ83526.1 Glutathione S-transferase family protein [Klebsormidium nitens]
MAPVTIYGMNMSTCTRRVITTLEEKSVPYEVVTVDLSKGAHKQPDHLARQPFGQIPAFEDGDVKVFESRAIARYISNKWASQGTDLLGKTAAEKALTDTWVEVEAQNYNPPLSTIVAQKVFLPMYGQQTDEKVVAQETEKLEKVLAVYDAHLADKEYLNGSSFSAADLSHLAYTDYYVNKGGGEAVLKKYPNVWAWWQRISSRPSWQKVSAMY